MAFGLYMYICQISWSGHAVSCRRLNKRSHHSQATKRHIHQAATAYLPTTLPHQTRSSTTSTRTTTGTMRRQFEQWLAPLFTWFYSLYFTSRNGLHSDTYKECVTHAGHSIAFDVCLHFVTL